MPIDVAQKKWNSVNNNIVRASRPFFDVTKKIVVLRARRPYIYLEGHVIATTCFERRSAHILFLFQKN